MNPLRRCLGMALPQPRKDMKTHIWTRRMLHCSVTSLWSHSFPTAIINKHFYHSYFGKNTVTTPLWDRSSETIKEKTEFHCMCVGTIPQRTIIKMPIVYRCWDNPSSKKKLLVVKKNWIRACFWRHDTRSPLNADPASSRIMWYHIILHRLLSCYLLGYATKPYKQYNANAGKREVLY